MKPESRRRTGKMIYAPPLVIALACALLVVVIAVFAVNNYRREKVLMEGALRQEGAAILNIVAAGSRDALRRSFTRGEAPGADWPGIVSQVIAATAEHPGLRALYLVDDDGVVLAHSDESLAGTRLTPEMLAAVRNLEPEFPARTAGGIVEPEHGPSFFLMAAHLEPAGLFQNRPGGPRRMHRLPPENTGSIGPVGASPFHLAAELSLDGYRQAVRKQLMQIATLSAVLCLVSLAGLLSLGLLQSLKGSERQLQRFERDAAIGRVAAGVAHELRNPLSSIKGLAVLLRSRAAAESVSSETAQLLIDEVDRLDRSIAELLDYAKPAAANLNNLELDGLTARAVLLIRSDAEAAGIEISTSYDCGKCIVRGDEDKLTQVILNLCLNSIQAMAGGGRLLLATRVEGRWACLEISDTGGGIDPEVSARLFEPYVTAKPGGTGLGLALSRKIVEDHDGSIHIDSVAGEGTTALVKLPLRSVQPRGPRDSRS